MYKDKNIGKIFGCYKIIDIAEPYITPGGQKKKNYLCECVKCRNNKIVNAYEATHNKQAFCPKCRPKKEPENLVGQKFGRLTVLKRADNHMQPNGSSKVVWECACDCGNIITVQGHKLKSGHTKSCGCFRRIDSLEKLKKKFIGKRFNKLIVLDHDNENKGTHYWKCKCDCGKECVVSSRYLQNKKLIHSCGCERSKAENDMANILTEKEISYTKQYSFNDCVDIRPLPFDFAIFNENNKLIFLIELHGEQHYYPFTYCGESDEQKYINLKDRQKKDNFKEEYCKNNKIPLLIIKYTDFDKLEIIFDNYYKRNKDNKLEKVIEKSNIDFDLVKKSTRKHHWNGVYQIDLKSEKILKKWDVINDLSRTFGYSICAIIDCCAKRRKTAYGYGWAYVDDFDLQETLNFCLVPDGSTAKATLQIDKDTGKIIKEWRSATDAAIEMNCSSNSISSCCRGEIKTCKGFVWKYK